MGYVLWSSKDIVDALREIDENEDISVSSWEANFLDSVFKWDGELTDKQRAKSIEIITKYAND